MTGKESIPYPTLPNQKGEGCFPPPKKSPLAFGRSMHGYYTDKETDFIIIHKFIPPQPEESIFVFHQSQWDKKSLKLTTKAYSSLHTMKIVIRWKKEVLNQE